MLLFHSVFLDESVICRILQLLILDHFPWRRWEGGVLHKLINCTMRSKRKAREWEAHRIAKGEAYFEVCVGKHIWIEQHPAKSSLTHSCKFTVYLAFPCSTAHYYSLNTVFSASNAGTAPLQSDQEYNTLPQ